MENLKKKCDSHIEQFIVDQPTNYHDILRDVFHGGKRLRQMIFLNMVDNLNRRDCKKICADNIALAIEIIHNSSLILDDLPCMDNDDYRRNKETIHKKYGYSHAVEFSMYLIKCAFKLIYTDLKTMDNNIELIFIYNKILYENLGKNGLVSGQTVDLDFLRKKIGLDTKNDYKNLIYKKTTTLFNLSFALSYALFDTNSENIDKVLLASKSFGLVFQLYDDFTDKAQDQKAHTPNFVLKYGHSRAISLYNKNVSRLYANLKELNIDYSFMEEICNMLTNKVKSCTP